MIIVLHISIALNLLALGLIYWLRKEINTDSPRLSTIISTRNTIEIAELIMDGFSIHDAAQLLIYPLYPNDGNDSERVFVKQLIQKYVGSKSKKQLFDLTDLED